MLKRKLPCVIHNNYNNNNNNKMNSSDGVLKQVKLSWKNNNNTNSIKIKLPSHHHQDDLHIHSTMPTLPAFLG